MQYEVHGVLTADGMFIVTKRDGPTFVRWCRPAGATLFACADNRDTPYVYDSQKGIVRVAFPDEAIGYDLPGEDGTIFLAKSRFGLNQLRWVKLGPTSVNRLPDGRQRFALRCPFCQRSISGVLPAMSDRVSTQNMSVTCSTCASNVGLGWYDACKANLKAEMNT